MLQVRGSALLCRHSAPPAASLRGAGAISSKLLFTSRKHARPQINKPGLQLESGDARPVMTAVAWAASAELLPEESTAASSTPSGGRVGSLPAWLTSLWRRVGQVALVAGLAIAVALTTGTGAAHAARSGGRVGGSSFGGSRSSGGGALSSGRTSSSLGGGGFGGSSGFGGGLRASSSVPTHSHSTVVVGMPMFGPSLGFGGFGGGGYVSHGSSTGGSFLLNVLLLSVAAMGVAYILRTQFGRGDAEDDVSSPPITVAKVQVGLLAIAHDLRAELDMLALKADTRSPAGLHMVLQETVLALLRNPEMCVFGASASQTVREERSAETLFGQMSLGERSKFTEETLSNVSGLSRRKGSRGAPGGIDELVVVTLLVAAEGKFELPTIRSLDDLKLALSRMGGVTPSQLLAVEVQWTPQEQGDSLSQGDVVLQYPELTPL